MDPLPAEARAVHAWQIRPSVTGNLTNGLMPVPAFRNAKLIEFLQKVQIFPGITAVDYPLRILTAEAPAVYSRDVGVALRLLTIDFPRLTPQWLRCAVIRFDAEALRHDQPWITSRHFCPTSGE